MIGLLMRISRGAHQFQASGKYNTPSQDPPRTTPAVGKHGLMPAADAFLRARTLAHNPPITLWLQPMFAGDFPLLLGLLSAPLPSLERPGMARTPRGHAVSGRPVGAKLCATQTARRASPAAPCGSFAPQSPSPHGRL